MKKANEFLINVKNPDNLPLSDIFITDIQTDSRLVESNQLFIALEGFQVDGHDFIDQAIERQASLILANEKYYKTLSKNFPTATIVYVSDTKDCLPEILNQFFDYPSEKLTVYGVTGTNGKTSVTYILNHILETIGRKVGVIGTIQAKLANKQSLQLANTTPDALTLQKLFHEMVDEGFDDSAIEVSSVGLDQNRTSGTDFSVAIFTNFTQDHLDYHQTMEDYFQSKLQLFKALPKVNRAGEKTYAIINSDDPMSDKIIEATEAAVITYGLQETPDFKAENIQEKALGTTFDLVFKGVTYSVSTQLIGRFNVLNILAAVAAVYSQQIAIADAILAIESLAPIKGRLQRVSDSEKDNISVYVDYAHTPDGLMKVLEAAHDIDPHDIISIVGCGGDRDQKKRPTMAQIACDKSSLAVFTSDNPRTENQNHIFIDMLKELQGENYVIFPSRKQAIHQSILNAEPGTVIVITGKGHENYQMIGKEKKHFDDAEESLEALELRRTTRKF